LPDGEGDDALIGFGNALLAADDTVPPFLAEKQGLGQQAVGTLLPRVTLKTVIVRRGHDGRRSAQGGGQQAPPLRDR
jgi:hypothetical protein